MKIVILERDSLGIDVDMSEIDKLGEVTVYAATTVENAAEHIGDADIIIANKLPLNETTLRKAKNLKFVAQTATGTNNVDFSYTPGTPIIQNLNFHAEPGSLTAIVGPTGAGKTTIECLKTLIKLNKKVSVCINKEELTKIKEYYVLIDEVYVFDDFYKIDFINNLKPLLILPSFPFWVRSSLRISRLLQENR